MITLRLETHYFLANITIPQNLSYVVKRSNVNLSWTYDFGAGARIAYVEWYFSKTNNPLNYQLLADTIGGKLYYASPKPLSDISISLPSTLILNNVTMAYNGTYKIVVNVAGVTPTPESKVVVIILGNCCPFLIGVSRR